MVENNKNFTLQYPTHQQQIQKTNQQQQQAQYQKQISPNRNEQNRVNNELFDKNLIKLSESVYRMEGEMQNNLVSIEQKNKAAQQNRINPISYQHELPVQNRQFLYPNRPISHRQ